jgi:hypothetical protein
MNRIVDNPSRPRSKHALVAGLALSAVIALCSAATSAKAEDHWRHDRGWHHGWTGGYYAAPPVVYGAPAYYPPPVVYGPGIGINIGIR